MLGPLAHNGAQIQDVQVGFIGGFDVLRNIPEDLHILAARLALAEGILSPDEIASVCGFSSQAYFCTIFKKVTGRTPLQYREERFRKR